MGRRNGKGKMMDQKRIDEIRGHLENDRFRITSLQDVVAMASDVPALLGALEEAQAESARLREALEEAETSVLSIEWRDSEGYLRECPICRRRNFYDFNLELEQRNHAQDCPFAILERRSQ